MDSPVNVVLKKPGKFVFSVKVKTKDMYADIFQGIKNMLGMNLTAYEKMMTTAINEALADLYSRYPNIDPASIQIMTSKMSNGAAEVIVSGVVYDE